MTLLIVFLLPYIGAYYKLGDAKKRVMTAAVGGNWKVAATANGVPVHIAYGWICKIDESTKLRGEMKWKGKNCKIEVRHIDTMLEWLSQSPLLTLKQTRDKLITEEKLDASTTATTIHKHLDGQF